MVEKQIADLLSRYRVDASYEAKNEQVHMVNVVDHNKPNMELTIQYVDDAIYAVKFLNNDFFEIENDALYRVISAILEGNYEVKTTLFRRNKFICIKDDKGSILPERTSKLSPTDKQAYGLLPSPFSSA